MNMNLVKMDNELVGDMSLDEMGVLSQQLNDMRMKKINEKLKVYGKDIDFLKQKSEEQSVQIEDLKESKKELLTTIDILRGATYVLATDDGKRRELSKKVNALTYKTTKGKNSIMDKLFHMSIAQSCYRYLFDIFQVTTYSRIKIDDYDIAMKSIGNWFNNKQNIKKCVGKRLNDYMNDLDKGVLSNEKEKLLDKYLDRTENGTKDFE